MELNEVIKDCNSLNDICKKLFNKTNYTNREKVKKLMYDEGINWKEWLQTIKNSKKKYCLVCGKELKKGQYKFCSHSCSASYNNIGVVRNGKERNHKCLYCGDKLEKNQIKFCSHECQRKFDHNKYIEKWIKGEEKGMCGKYGLFKFIRRYLFEKHNNKCQKCGWGEINPHTNKVPLEVHHIDGDYTNNTEDNLQLLCPNCHSLTDTYKASNKNGRKGRKKYS